MRIDGDMARAEAGIVGWKWDHRCCGIPSRSLLSFLAVASAAAVEKRGSKACDPYSNDTNGNAFPWIMDWGTAKLCCNYLGNLQPVSPISVHNLCVSTSPEFMDANHWANRKTAARFQAPPLTTPCVFPSTKRVDRRHSSCWSA